MSADTIAAGVNDAAQEWSSQSSTLAARAAKSHIPLSGTFELTPFCNLRCKMCYVRLDKSQVKPGQRELTADEWINLARDAADAGTLDLLITGGEPLLRPDFPKIYTELAHMGFITVLYTNATLMNRELFELFKKYPPSMVGVTLYGASRETYQNICGNPDAFDMTLRGLDMFSEISTTLEVRTTFIKDNMGELDAIRATANRYTKRFVTAIEIFKAIRGASADVASCRMTPAEMYDLDEKNRKYYDNLNSPDEKELKAETISERHEKDDREKGFDIEPKILTCLAAKAMYHITWDGKMLPCGSFSSPYTLPLEEGFIPAWNRLPELYRDLRHPDKCYDCEFLVSGCPNCPASVQTESGSFDEVGPYLCSIAAERAKRFRKQNPV